jgi:hypothetical protein
MMLTVNRHILSSSENRKSILALRYFQKIHGKLRRWLQLGLLRYIFILSNEQFVTGIKKKQL